MAASAGGHLTQLEKLKDLWTNAEHFFVTTSPVVAVELQRRSPAFGVGECNRASPFAAVRSFWRCLRILLRERPHVVLSTGAMVGCFCCIIGRLLGARVIWVDSVANTKRLSLSGRIVRPFAGAVFTQWPEVAEKYSSVQYRGALL